MPAVGTPLTHTWEGGLSMNADVQSPARETAIRYPTGLLRGAGLVAKVCQPDSRCRLIALADPTSGVTPCSNPTRATCDDGRRTLMGTRRSRSDGSATETGAVSSSQIDGE